MFFKTATMSLVSLHFHFFQEFQDFYLLLCLAGTLRDVLSNCQSGNVNVIMWVFFPLSLSPSLSLSDSLSPSLSSLSLWLSLSPSLSLSLLWALWGIHLRHQTHDASGILLDHMREGRSILSVPEFHVRFDVRSVCVCMCFPLNLSVGFGSLPCTCDMWHEVCTVGWVIIDCGWQVFQIRSDKPMRPFSILQLETWENLNRTFFNFHLPPLVLLDCWNLKVELIAVNASRNTNQHV